MRALFLTRVLPAALAVASITAPCAEVLAQVADVLTVHPGVRLRKEAAKAQTPQRQPTGLRADYLRLAEMLSFDYRLDGREVAPTAKPAVLDTLRNANSPQLKQAANWMLVGLAEEKKLQGSGQQAATEAARLADEVRRAAQGGKLTSTEVYVDTDGRRREYEIDRSLLPQLLSSLGASVASEVSPEVEKIHRRLMLDGARIRSWDELLPEMPQPHAGPPAPSRLVQVDYLDDGPGGQPLQQSFVPTLPFAPSAADTFRGRYVATNIAGRDLHNVTLAVDMLHYSTMPAAALRHVYFVPLWKDGQKLEFSRSFFLDQNRGGEFYSVVAMEESADGFPMVNPELSRLAGIVKVQTTLWSDEARQTPTMQTLDARAKAVSAVLISYAERTAISTYSQNSAQMRINEHLTPVVDMLAANSAEALHARRLMADYKVLKEELIQKQHQSLVSACSAGKKYLAWRGGDSRPTRIGLFFVSCDADGKRVRAELFDPLEPSLRRSLGGYWKDVTDEKVLVLQTLQGPPAAPDLDPRSIHAASPLTLTLKLKAGDLVVHAITGTTSLLRSMFKEVASTPQELADAKRRDEAAPQSTPQPPVAAVANSSPTVNGSAPTEVAVPSVTLPQSTPGPATGAAVPAVTANVSGPVATAIVDDVEYAFQGAVRSGANVVVSLMVTSRKGDRPPPNSPLMVTDDAGRTYMGQLMNVLGARSGLKERKAVTLSWQFGGRIPLTGAAAALPPTGRQTTFAKVSLFTPGGSIEFRNVPAVKRSGK